MIESFKDRQTLANEYNFRTLAKTLRPDTLTWKGNRLVKKGNQAGGNQPHNTADSTSANRNNNKPT